MAVQVHYTAVKGHQLFFLRVVHFAYFDPLNYYTFKKRKRALWDY